MRYRVGLDTNVLFSGLYFGGNPGEIIKMVENDECVLVLPEYVWNELRMVAERKGVDIAPVELLQKLGNVKTMLDSSYFKQENFALAKELVRDEKDRPVFAFELHALRRNLIDYLVSGDGDLLTKEVRTAINGRVVAPAEFLEIVERTNPSV